MGFGKGKPKLTCHISCKDWTNLELLVIEAILLALHDLKLSC